MRPPLPALICTLGLLGSPIASASEPNPSAAETSVAVETNPPKFDRRADTRWIRRWRPEARLVEAGVYGGVFLFSQRHELYEPQVELPEQGWESLRRVNPAVGARVGFYPFRFVGVELEGGAMPTQVGEQASGAVPFTLRGHFVGQLGLWSVTPFVLIGGGMIGVDSKGPLGTDVDPALTIGGGVKIYVNRWIALRVDVRDLVSHARGVDQTFEAHNLEALLGLSVVLNRRNAPPRPAPPVEPEPEPELEPIPEPPLDRDGDGFLDDVDACVDEPGVEPDGCPIRDSDGDGLLDDVDSCVDEPESVNGFLDADGCPDALPEAIQKFTGSIVGITFETNQATIRRASLPTLDEAVRVLLEYPDVRFEISGHTDDQGAREHNLELSQQRAESVANYLVGMGVDEARIVTVGVGPDRPIADNTTKSGRASNRRIEFRILTD